MNNLFSIIVPVYNKEKYIKQCIESIINQSYKDFELILVDDGSSDNSSLICDEYARKDNRVKIIHKENGGLVSARKSGCKIANGEYIACVDSDDYIKEDFLLKIKDEIEKNRPDIICFGHYTLENVEKKSEIQFKSGFYNRNGIIADIFPYLIQNENSMHIPVNICFKVFKKSLYSKIQLDVDDSVSIGEDGCVSIPCIYLANSLSIIDEYIYVYRKNLDSMTNKHIVLPLDYPEKVYREIIRHVDATVYDFDEQLNRLVVHQLFSLIISMFNYNKTYKEIKIIINNLLTNPFYNDIINKTRFKGSVKAELMLLLLKKRFIYIIYLVSRIY